MIFTNTPEIKAFRDTYRIAKYIAVISYMCGLIGGILIGWAIWR